MEENLDFSKTAKELARNPLGIIALFIILVHSFASLLLGFTADNLRANERALFIWFIILFPVLVLFVFTYLVICHHGKLYGPREHRTMESFYGISTPQQRDDKLSQKLVSVTATGHGYSSESTVHRAVPINLKIEEPTFESSATETQFAIEQVRSKYLQAESLTIRRLEQIYGYKFEKHISFGGETSMAFDAVALNGDTFNAVEIKLLTRPILIPSDFREVLQRGSLTSRFIDEISENRFFRLILVVVLESIEDLVERFELEVRRVIQDSPFPIDFHIFSFGELRHDFGAPND